MNPTTPTPPPTSTKSPIDAAPLSVSDLAAMGRAELADALRQPNVRLCTHDLFARSYALEIRTLRINAASPGEAIFLAKSMRPLLDFPLEHLSTLAKCHEILSREATLSGRDQHSPGCGAWMATVATIMTGIPHPGGFGYCEIHWRALSLEFLGPRPHGQTDVPHYDAHWAAVLASFDERDALEACPGWPSSPSCESSQPPRL